MAVKVVGEPWQTGLLEPTVKLGIVFTVTVPVFVTTVGVLFAGLVPDMVTLYTVVTVGLTVMEEVVAPPGFHEYVGFMMLVPVIKVAEPFGQMVALVTPLVNKAQFVEPVPPVWLKRIFWLWFE